MSEDSIVSPCYCVLRHVLLLILRHVVFSRCLWLNQGSYFELIPFRWIFVQEWLFIASEDLFWTSSSCLLYLQNGVIVLKPYSLEDFSSVSSLSRVWLFVTSWTATHQASPSITNSWSSPRLASIESVMPFSHLILCHPLLLLPTMEYYSAIKKNKIVPLAATWMD